MRFSTLREGVLGVFPPYWSVKDDYSEIESVIKRVQIKRQIKREQIERQKDGYADKASPLYARECSEASLPIGQLETIIVR